MKELDVLQTLCQIDAPSGWEGYAADDFISLLERCCEKVYTDAMGNVIGRMGKSKRV